MIQVTENLWLIHETDISMSMIRKTSKIILIPSACFKATLGSPGHIKQKYSKIVRNRVSKIAINFFWMSICRLKNKLIFQFL